MCLPHFWGNSSLWLGHPSEKDARPIGSIFPKLRDENKTRFETTTKQRQQVSIAPPSLDSKFHDTSSGSLPL